MALSSRTASALASDVASGVDQLLVIADPITLTPNDSTLLAMSLLIEHQLKWLPVVQDRETALTGP